MRSEDADVLQLQFLTDIVKGFTGEFVGYLQTHRCKFPSLLHKFFHTFAEIGILAGHHYSCTSCKTYERSVKNFVALEHEVCEMEHDLFFEYEALAASVESDHPLALIVVYRDNADSYALL